MEIVNVVRNFNILKEQCIKISRNASKLKTLNQDNEKLSFIYNVFLLGGKLYGHGSFER